MEIHLQIATRDLQNGNLKEIREENKIENEMCLSIYLSYLSLSFSVFLSLSLSVCVSEDKKM